MAIKLRCLEFTSLTTLLTHVSRAAHADKRTWSMTLNYPECISKCVAGSGSGCSAKDVGCMCKASDRSFLSDVVVCMNRGCSQAISVDTLLDPLQVACDMFDIPIPASAISSAEAAGSTTKTSTASVKTTRSTTSPRVTFTMSNTISSRMTSQTCIITETTTETASKTMAVNTNSPKPPASWTTTTIEIQLPATSTNVGTGTDAESNVATSTDTGGPTDQTDSSPFAAPMGSGRQERASLLGAAVSLAAMVIVGW